MDVLFVLPKVPYHYFIMIQFQFENYLEILEAKY